MKKIFLIISLVVLLVGLMSFANSEVSYCCEKTSLESDGSGGAWCQNAPEENCDEDFKKAPTSCEATSYCKKGTCYDSQEGTCDPNTPQKSCEDNGGVWEAGEPEDLPQCQLGCCLIGDQAAYVTQTRCKRLSSLYGLEILFKTNFGNEIECIESATSDVKGACVFEKEFEKTCLLITKKECKELEGSGTEADFYEDYLCSDESLGTNCGPTEQTTCVEGRDEVYFLDSCGNLANIYDATRIRDKSYWSKIVGKEDSCGFNNDEGNADSRICGNCNYYLGSTCKTKTSISPIYGDNICHDLDCVYEGEKYKHGETWCADAKGVDDNLPGSRNFRLVCYNGEVSIESCADYRQEVCLQSEVNGFKTAACRVNRWQECYSQQNKRNCEDEDKRDCKWIDAGWVPKQGDTPGLVKQSGGACVPLYSPGVDFWESSGDVNSLCSMGDATCVVLIRKKMVGGSKCILNCECLLDSWKAKMKQICTSITDCGDSRNYLGLPGY
ncbi:MAG: hypothetical protein PVJ67_01395 [Candidatus Pacearchaeota archaeon]|jgi:hypothetical protein